MNYDGNADLVAFQHGVDGGNGVFVGLSTGSSFRPAQRWGTDFCTSTETCEFGNVDDSQNADFIAFTRDPSNDVLVSLTTQSGFYLPTSWSSFFCRTGEVCLSADFNGDFKSDLIAFNHGLDRANAVYVATSTGSRFTPAAKASDHFCTLRETCAVGDVTGDGRADVIAFTRGATPQAYVGVSLR